LGNDCELVEFKYFPHGFLSYDLPILFPEASVTNDVVMAEMEKFLE
jgi:hypothetical protein